MSTTITQHAPCCASLAMTSSVIILAATEAKKSARPDGVARIARNQPAQMDAFTERASGQVFVNAATAIKEQDVTNANHIQDARMASAQNHGSVAALETGVEYSVTKVSYVTNYITLNLLIFA